MVTSISDISGVSSYSYYEDIKTITFLDSYESLPSDIDDNSFDISENGDGCVMLYIHYSQEDQTYDFYIVGDGGVDANPNGSKLFCNLRNCESIDFNNCFCTTNVTDMSYMFYDCESLTSLDVSSFITSNVTQMGYMFNYCKVLKDLDISGFDMSNVEDKYFMLEDCPAGEDD